MRGRASFDDACPKHKQDDAASSRLADGLDISELQERLEALEEHNGSLEDELKVRQRGRSKQVARFGRHRANNVCCSIPPSRAGGAAAARAGG